MDRRRPIVSGCGCCLDVDRLINIVSQKGLSSFGGRFNDDFTPINIVVGQEVIPLPEIMPGRDVEYSDNSITIEENGIYEINYSINVSAEVAALVTTSVRVNGQDIDSTVISRLIDVDLGTVYSGSTIVELNSGDVIDMAISALIAVEVTLGNGVNASLSIRRIG